MTIEQVKEIVLRQNASYPSFSEIGNEITGIGINSHFAIIHYLDITTNNSLFNRFHGLSSGTWYVGNITANEYGRFYFHNGRLTTVILLGYTGGIQALKTRYGNGRRIDFRAFSLNGSPATIWLENRQRYIVFYRNLNFSEDCVAYVDANWINNIYNDFLRETNERDRQSRELLD